MKIVLTEPLSIAPEYLDQLIQPYLDQGHEFICYDTVSDNDSELIRRTHDADIVLLANHPFSEEVVGDLDNCQYLNIAFTGVDHVAVQSAKKKNILLSNASGYSNTAVSELVIGLTLDLYRNISKQNQMIRQGHTFSGPIMGQEIKGKTVAILGTGKIGSQTAELFHALGAKLIAYDQSENETLKQALPIQYLSLDNVISQADIVTLHLPLTDDTHHLIDQRALQQMKSSAVLINAARGPIIDQTALCQALDQGQIAGAAIDVFDQEPPLNNDHPYFKPANLLLTPHIGYLTQEAMNKRAQIVFDNLKYFLDGEPQNLV